MLQQISDDVQASLLSESEQYGISKNRKRIKLVQTSSVAPEQYDAFLGTQLVGYMRLRHGKFQVDFRESGGEIIYEAVVAGDGAFLAEERDHFLYEAVRAIEARLAKDKL